MSPVENTIDPPVIVTGSAEALKAIPRQEIALHATNTADLVMAASVREPIEGAAANEVPDGSRDSREGGRWCPTASGFSLT
jgi:hypothetical protein